MPVFLILNYAQDLHNTNRNINTKTFHLGADEQTDQLHRGILLQLIEIGTGLQQRHRLVVVLAVTENHEVEEDEKQLDGNYNQEANDERSAKDKKVRNIQT